MHIGLKTSFINGTALRSCLHLSLQRITAALRLDG